MLAMTTYINRYVIHFLGVHHHTEAVKVVAWVL